MGKWGQTLISEKEKDMPKMVTMKMDDETYNLLTILALQENRPLENFIETAALRYYRRAWPGR